MAALRDCAKFAARLSDAEATDLIDRVDAYIASGIAPAEAQRAATNDILAEIEGERSEVLKLAQEKVPEDAPVEAADEAIEAPQFSQTTEPPPQAGPGFYSALRRAVADAKTNASPAEYWTNLIKGKVSQEDLQASGFAGWLGEQEGKTKKADVLGWITDNQPEGAAAEVQPPADDLALSQTETPEFKKWFGASKLVDDDGKPKVYYHATTEDFDKFKPGGKDATISGPAIWLSPYADYQAAFHNIGSRSDKFRSGTRVMPLYVRMERPLVIDTMDMLEWAREVFAGGSKEFPQLMTKKWADEVTRDNEYDGIIFDGEAIGWKGKTSELVVFDQKQIKSVFNRGTWDGADDRISFSQTQQQPLSTPNQTWTGPGLSKLDDFLYNWQNKFVDLKRVVDAIKEGTGASLGDRRDGELRETLYTGRVSARIQNFERDDLLPLLQEMRLAKVEMADLGKYLHARHAAERNAEMKARNANRPNNDALSGMSDADAAAILANAPPVMQRLAARIDTMIAGTRNLMEISGIESAETVDALRRSYQHYVPLHREESDSDHSSHPIGQGFSVKGSVPKRALGSEKAVAHADILSHIISEREQVIIRAEKNLVAMSVYHMALRNPNDAFWKTDAPPQVGYIDERATIFVPGQGMVPNPNQGQVVYRADPNYKNRPEVLVAKINGVDRTVIFEKSDPRAMRLAESLKNLDVENLAWGTRVAGWATRQLAAMNTQYNPVFSVKNFIRDLSGGLINLSSTDLAGDQAKVAAGIHHAMRAIYRTERGKSTTNQQWADLYEDFRLRGAKTGYREVFMNESERTKELIRRTERLAGKIAPVQMALDWLSHSNDAIENAIRLSAYKVALDKGLSKDRAASIAKNLTVNFNRKGAKTAEFNSWYMFFNAGIQGSARLVQTMKGPAAVKILAGGFSLGVLQALAMLSMDDDEREAVPEFVKRMSIVIPYRLFGVETGEFFQVPLPLGLHVIPNTSRSLTELVLRVNKGDKVDIPTHIASTLGAALDAFNPFQGHDAIQTILPTVADPIAQVVINENWVGRPIYRERTDGTQGKPGYQMGNPSTSPVYKELARVIHLVGNDMNPDVRNIDRLSALSPQPEALRLIPETIFGGVWRETEKLIDTAIGMTKETPVDRARIPLLSAFYGDASKDMAVQGTYHRNIDKLDARRGEIKSAGANDREVRESWMDDIPRARVLAVKKQMLALTTERRELILDGNREAEILELEKEMGEIMREFNAEVRAAQRKPAAVE